MPWKTLEEARAIVARQCQSDIDPSIDNDEIDAILQETVHAAAWQASTSYAYGTLVVPTTRTGYVFAPVKAGTSGTQEPTWPVNDRAFGPFDSRWHYELPYVWQQWDFTGTVEDGTVTWALVQPDFSDIWDITAATYQCWLLKASKVDVMGGQDVTMARVGDVEERYGSGGGIKAHCLQMADRYRPLQVA